MNIACKKLQDTFSSFTCKFIKELRNTQVPKQSFLTLALKSCKINPPPLPKTFNHQQTNYSVCMLLQMLYLHLIENVGKAHSLKSMPEHGPEQWKIRPDVAEVRWDPKAKLKFKRRNSVDENVGQVCCAQQPGALPWDFLSLSQPQLGQCLLVTQGSRAWQLLQPHCWGAQTCSVASPSLLDTLNQPQGH